MSAARIIFSWRWRAGRRSAAGSAALLQAGRTTSGRPSGRPSVRPPSQHSEKGSGRPGRRKGSVPGTGPGDGCQVTGRTVFCSRDPDGMQAHLRGLHGGRCGQGAEVPGGRDRTATADRRPAHPAAPRVRQKNPRAGPGCGSRCGQGLICWRGGGCVRGFCGRPRRSVAFALLSPPPPPARITPFCQERCP